MSRVAIVAPDERLRDALAAVADAGTVELAGPLPSAEGEAVEALRRVERASPNGRADPRLARALPDVAALEREGRGDLLAGEVELLRRSEAARHHDGFAALVGWAPTEALDDLAARLAPRGAAVLELPHPRWVEPPTLLPQAPSARPLHDLVDTYGAMRYTDVDPTPFAALAFVLMFGMMFGDVGHGALLVALGLWLRTRTSGRLAGFARLWAFPVAAGAAAIAFGLLYGEAFGPTGLVPVLWLAPTEEPIQLLTAALAVGAGLLAVSYAIGIVNRWRERGRTAGLLAPSGIAGLLLFVGIGLLAAGWYADRAPASIAGGLATGIGVLLLGLGFQLEAGRGAAAVTQATVEVVDTVIRTVANVISFARLAAFGLMHAALAALVLTAAQALWGGVAGAVLAVVVFIVGNVLTFALEALVAGVQALRLEYYELFSRIFEGVGRPFAPWHVPFDPAKESS